MQKENLEQIVGLMDKFRGVARKTVGVYALGLVLGVGWGGCETEEENEKDMVSCTPPSSSDGCHWDSCDNNEECKCSKPKDADDYQCHCGCHYVHQPKGY